ncbi:ran-3 [Pristionchus pacificus]|uniref:Ran-3 n=1 Tax=Pristionchus pacificus TaxID=54126 RepID=A0A2A6B9D4_PRIPA|nr:ran-3 [Pristionchus pacificus]|eukprot:PDM62490.1 ran-3 [Pristionchus pacificus]
MPPKRNTKTKSQQPSQPDEAKVEETKAEEAKVEATEADEAKVEESKAEEAKVDNTKEESEEEKMETEQDPAEAAPNADSNTEDEKMEDTEGEASAESKDEKEDDGQKSPPKKRGRAAKKAPAPPKETEPKTGRGRKRKTSEADETSGGPSAPPTPSKKGGKTKGLSLSYEDFINKSNLGDRVLSCGEGEQLGHPGRTTTKKPRKVDIVEEDEMKIVQVVAGGVHSLLLTDDNRIFSCGINEKGTVPAEGVERDGSTDEFAEIKLADLVPNFADEHGKVVMMTAGASFSAALTDKGSVIAWGNLRDQSGEVNVHPLLHEMKEKPVVIIHRRNKVIAKIAAGENHLAMLSHDGHIFTFGDGSMGQLGRTTRTGTIRSRYMVDGSGDALQVKVLDKKYKELLFKDIHAAGYWTAAISVTDTVYTFGLNNFGHLGTPFDKTLREEEEQVAGAGDVAPQEDDRDFKVCKPTEADAYGKRNYTHMAGVQHIVARSADGEVFAIGKNTDNALGLGTWTGNDDTAHWRYTTLQKVEKLNTKMSGCSAKLGASIAWDEDGNAFGWGCDTSGQLGLGIKDDDDKVVSEPSPISSAHLDGYKIISVSVADNHSLFLAKKVE